MPPVRNSAFSDELMQAYDRARELRAKIAKLEDELGPLEKRLTWTLMPEAFGSEHWGPHCPSPADPGLDNPLPHGGTLLHRDWPFLQRDSETLTAAWREWKRKRPCVRARSH